ncbi:transmembrane protein, putative, partial [Bodo saltans]
PTWYCAYYCWDWCARCRRRRCHERGAFVRRRHRAARDGAGTAVGKAKDRRQRWHQTSRILGKESRPAASRLAASWVAGHPVRRVAAAWCGASTAPIVSTSRTSRSVVCGVLMLCVWIALPVYCTWEVLVRARRGGSKFALRSVPCYRGRTLQRPASVSRLVPALRSAMLCTGSASCVGPAAAARQKRAPDQVTLHSQYRTASTPPTYWKTWRLCSAGTSFFFVLLLPASRLPGSLVRQCVTDLPIRRVRRADVVHVDRVACVLHVGTYYPWAAWQLQICTAKCSLLPRTGTCAKQLTSSPLNSQQTCTRIEECHALCTGSTSSVGPLAIYRQQRSRKGHRIGHLAQPVQIAAKVMPAGSR